MSDALLVLGGRSEKERQVFGGEVTVSLDGKVIGSLEDEDRQIEVDAGPHTVRMSKSHDYGSQIGIASEAINVKPGDKLLITYTAPLLVNAPGLIMVADYDGRNLQQRIQDGQDKPIESSIAASKEKQALQQLRNDRYNTILIGTVIAIGIIGLIFSLSIAHIASAQP